ncbi:hypothetical protein, partial [Caldibacillus debilis]|uniref:hypothetical protein n=1 Tax=Caldibacillus debilis TaxID=301148 RepID=UPI001F376978
MLNFYLGADPSKSKKNQAALLPISLPRNEAHSHGQLLINLRNPEGSRERMEARKELIALFAITCSAKLCETCQKNFPPFFDVKIEEI